MSNRIEIEGDKIIAAVNTIPRNLSEMVMADLYLLNVILRHRYSREDLPKEEDIPADKKYALDLLRRIKKNLMDLNG